MAQTPDAAAADSPRTRWPDLLQDSGIAERRDRMGEELGLVPALTTEIAVEDLILYLERTAPDSALLSDLAENRRTIADMLARAAGEIYHHNARQGGAWAAQLRGSPASARDTLVIYSRHWLCGLLRERHGPDVMALLPDGFASGHPPA